MSYERYPNLIIGKGCPKTIDEKDIVIPSRKEWTKEYARKHPEIIEVSMKMPSDHVYIDFRSTKNLYYEVLSVKQKGLQIRMEIASWGDEFLITFKGVMFY